MHMYTNWLALRAHHAGNIEEATSQVVQLVASAELRARVGAAGRQEVSLWDWRAATQHLLRFQYPIAMAAAALYYSRRKAGKAAPAPDAPSGPAVGAPSFA